jgi:hypothetical protein
VSQMPRLPAKVPQRELSLVVTSLNRILRQAARCLELACPALSEPRLHTPKRFFASANNFSVQHFAPQSADLLHIFTPNRITIVLHSSQRGVLCNYIPLISITFSHSFSPLIYLCRQSTESQAPPADYIAQATFCLQSSSPRVPHTPRHHVSQPTGECSAATAGRWPPLRHDAYPIKGCPRQRSSRQEKERKSQFDSVAL